MKTIFQVLDKEEIERIHSASMEVLETVGVRVDYSVARDLFRQAGAKVDEGAQSVHLSERLVMDAPVINRRLDRG
jgi:trimethylamine:corrinoid methyltransferase-like protein